MSSIHLENLKKATRLPKQTLLTVIFRLFYQLTMLGGCFAWKSELSSVRGPTQNHQIPAQRERFPKFSNQGIFDLLMFNGNFESLDEALISLRSLALALTPCPPLAGQVGNFCPFPALKVGFSPYVRMSARLSSSQAHVEACSPSMGTPTLPQMYLRDMSVHKTEETPAQRILTFLCFFPINEGLQKLSWSKDE